MNWLITIKEDLKTARIKSLLKDLGCEISDKPAIPLGAGEKAVQVTGPSDLPKKAKDIEEIIGIYPDSDISLF